MHALEASVARISNGLVADWFQTGFIPDAAERGGEQQQRFGSTRGDVRGSGWHDRRGDHASFTSRDTKRSGGLGAGDRPGMSRGRPLLAGVHRS